MAIEKNWRTNDDATAVFDAAAAKSENVKLCDGEEKLHDVIFNPATTKSVIVKLYDLEEGLLSLNDAVEFVGILSMDPLLSRGQCYKTFLSVIYRFSY